MAAAGGLPGGVRGGVQRGAVQRGHRGLRGGSSQRRCAAAGARVVQARCRCKRGVGALQARCRRGAGAVRGARCTRGAGAVHARWATHLERGDGHVGVALVLVLGRQPVVIAHVGHCAEEDHRGRRAVVRDEGADPALEDAPTARACGAWGGRCGCACGPLRRRLRRLDDPGLKAARLLGLEGPQQRRP